MTKNPCFMLKKKGILRFNTISSRELVKDKEIKLGFVTTNDQLADIFNKALPIDILLFRNQMKIQNQV